MSNLAPLTELDAFRALLPGDRLTLAHQLAGTLGPSFRPLVKLVGQEGLAGVEHVASGVTFVAIPGGSFEMGLRDDDAEEAEQLLGHGAALEAQLMVVEAMATPVRRVALTPFLLAVSHLSSAQVATLTAGVVDVDALTPDNAHTFQQAASGFRLPSEAELEYAGREGGALHFLADGARVYSTSGSWPSWEENGWGVTFLSTPTWAADEWHDSYKGAPSSAVPWSSGKRPSVFRGGLVNAAEDVVVAADVVLGLAAWRGRFLPPEDEWFVGVRPALSLSL